MGLAGAGCWTWQPGGRRGGGRTRRRRRRIRVRPPAPGGPGSDGRGSTGGQGDERLVVQRGARAGRRRLLRGELLDERPRAGSARVTPGSCPGPCASRDGPRRPAARPARPGRGRPTAAISASAGPAARRSVRRRVGSAAPRSSTPVGSPSASRQLPRSRRATAAALRLPARSRASIASLIVTSARSSPIRRSCCASSASTRAWVALAAPVKHISRASRSSAADRSSSPLIRAK